MSEKKWYMMKNIYIGFLYFGSFCAAYVAVTALVESDWISAALWSVMSLFLFRAGGETR